MISHLTTLRSIKAVRMNCSIKLHLKWYILRKKQQDCLFKNTHEQKKPKKITNKQKLIKI